MVRKTSVVQLKTAYKPRPSVADREREELRELALKALSNDQLGQALGFMSDLSKFLKLVAGPSMTTDR